MFQKLEGDNWVEVCVTETRNAMKKVYDDSDSALNFMRKHPLSELVSHDKNFLGKVIRSTIYRWVD